jgi:PAS domain S-box-containing protein
VLILGTLLGVLITAAAGWSTWREQSARHLVEKAQRETEEQYLDPQGQILSWNPGAEQMTGCTFAEIVGRNFSCFFPPDDI